MNRILSKRRLAAIPIALAIAALAACGGGSGGGGGSPTAMMPEPMPEPEITRIAVGGAPGDEVTFGPAGTWRGATVASGSTPEGEPADRVLEYLRTNTNGGPWGSGPYTISGLPGLYTFASPPVIRIAEGSDPRFDRNVRNAVDMINASLPNDQRIRIGAASPPGAHFSEVPDGEIFIELTQSNLDWNTGEENFDTRGASGITSYNPITEYDQTDNQWYVTGLRAAKVWQSQDVPADQWFSVTLHELLHALGMPAHVDAGDFPESAMRGSYLLITETLPAIDGDSLNAAVSRFSPGTRENAITPTSLGRWDTTRFHLQAEIPGDIGFGVSTRNGVGHAWASGPEPTADLSANPDLTGTVSWTGALLGVTRSDQTVGGAAAIGVDLMTLTGNAAFTELESWGVRTSPGTPGTGTLWLDGDLEYDIAVTGNTFRQTGGDTGTLDGMFVGEHHEGAAGTLDRTDLTAAFGTER